VVCHNGVACAHDGEALVRAMAARNIEIDCVLHAGMGAARVLTTDLSHAYIDENKGTS